MKDFYELNKPVYAGPQWFVKVGSGDTPLYLSHSLMICKSMPGVDNNPHLYFDTELLAHTAACNYYTAHAKQYPYSDAIINLCKELKGENVVVLQSQVMEF